MLTASTPLDLNHVVTFAEQLPLRQTHATRRATGISARRDIVTQLAAASKALDHVGFKMLASGLSSCLENPRKSAKAGYSVDEVEKLFLKLS